MVRRAKNVGAWLGGNRGTVQSSGGSNNQTIFDVEGNPVFPAPQFIGDMPTQLAGYDDQSNVKGRPATGAMQYDAWYATDTPLRFRGMKQVYINPKFANERNYFKNDADSAYRQRANRSANDAQITDHENINTMYSGVVQSAAAMSKYFNKPFTVLQPNQQVPERTSSGSDLYVTVTGQPDYPNVAGRAKAIIYKPQQNSKRNTSNINLNTSLSDQIFESGDGAFQQNAAGWADTFTHEFSHTLGGAHPHDNPRGTDRNSILSYRAENQKGKLLPADINAYKQTMGYGLTPQSIIKRIDTTGQLLNRPTINSSEEDPVIVPKVVKPKKNPKRK